MKIYDPLGVYSIKNGKISGTIGIILPADLQSDLKKFDIKKSANYDVSDGNGTNGILVIIDVKNKKGEDQLSLSGKKFPVCEEIELDVKLEDYKEGDDHKCRFIVFHSNNFDETENADVIKCAKSFIAEYKYDLNKNFEEYYKECGNNIVPDTVGGGILVGTGG